MTVLAIDPGPVKSAWLIYDSLAHKPVDFGHTENGGLLGLLHTHTLLYPVAIERMQSFGMPVGDTVFTTCYWIGRFQQVLSDRGVGADLVTRKDVKLHLCQSTRAKDPNVRQALLDMFPASGGGKTPQIGTKSQPGPLYGISGDVWSALAIAVYWCEEVRSG